MNILSLPLYMRLLVAILIYPILNSSLDILFSPLTTDSGQVVGELGYLKSVGTAFLSFIIPAWLSPKIIASRGQQFVMWYMLLFALHGTAVVEGYFFAPELIRSSLLVALLVSATDVFILTSMIIILFVQSGEPRTISNQLAKLSIWKTASRWIFASGFYIIVYFVFGMISYFLVLAPYYDAGIAGLTVPAPETVFKLQLIRSPILVLSILPVIMLVPESKKKLGAISGFLLAWYGGFVPLLSVSNILPIPVVAAHTVEIFFQNFSLGMMVTYLFWMISQQYSIPKAHHDT